MFIVTARYAEGNEGSQILAMFDNLVDAQQLMAKYAEQANFEIVEIQELKKNVTLADLNKIVPIKTADGDDFIEVDGVEHECQGEYFHACGLGSKTIESKELNGYH